MGMESLSITIAISRSSTRCKDLRAQAQTKAWQRVCLFQCSKKPSTNPGDENEQSWHINGLASHVTMRLKSSVLHLLAFVDEYTLRCLEISVNAIQQTLLITSDNT